MERCHTRQRGALSFVLRTSDSHAATRLGPATAEPVPTIRTGSRSSARRHCFLRDCARMQQMNQRDWLAERF